jgi:hypothetical protein
MAFAQTLMREFVYCFVGLAFAASVIFTLLFWLFSISQPWAPAFLYPDIHFREKFALYTTALPHTTALIIDGPTTKVEWAGMTADLAWMTMTESRASATSTPTTENLEDTTEAVTETDESSSGTFSGGVFGAAILYALFKAQAWLRRI